jgi:uncharacterized protein YbcI
MTDSVRSLGSVGADISRTAVQLFHEYTGRGPTQARTTINGDLVIIVLGSTLLKAERSLISAGDGDTVRQMRRRFQDVMRPDLTAAVEQQTGRKVIAFMSDNHMDPDLACEVFILESDGTEDGAGPSVDGAGLSVDGAGPSYEVPD